ncbi:MAG: hypothetical protein Q8S94_16345 [Pseudohongiella sp.]|nr:hypothetical protein [Pseudohongiella sp.]
MSQTSRKKSVKTSKKLKATSFMAMCISCGLFLGFGLGAMLNNVLLVTLIGLLSGAAIGYYIDKKNGIAYTQSRH